MRTYRLPGLAAAVAGVVGVVGCNPSRSPLNGTVSFDGKPIDNGGIQFVPLAGGEKVTLSSGPIRDGAYSIDATRGPFPGKYRVEVFWNKKTGKKKPSGEGGGGVDELTGKKNPGNEGGMIDETVEGLPPKYNAKSELTAEVTSGKNTLDFNLAP